MMGLLGYFAPEFSFRHDALSTVRMAAAAAIRQRWPDGLRMLLTAVDWFGYLAKPLLRLAAAHGDAACLELLLTYAAATDTGYPAPEHLVIAACRGAGDVHAAGVVALLLQELQQRRQLAAKWLKPAYAAACSSGNVAVLLQTLQVAAGAAAAQRHERHKQWHQRQHVLAVLTACAAAGIAEVWEQLLDVLTADSNASGSSSSSATHPSTCNTSTSSTQQDLTHHQQQQQQPGWQPGRSPSDHQQQQQQPAGLWLPGLHLSRLTPYDWLSVLHAVLPASRPYGIDVVDRTHAKALQNLQEATARCSMADQLWRCLQDAFPASELAIRQLLEGSCSWQVLGAGFSGAVLCRRVEGALAIEAELEADWVCGYALRDKIESAFGLNGNRQQQQQAMGTIDGEGQQQPVAVAAAAAAGGGAQALSEQDLAYRDSLQKLANRTNSCLITLAEELHPQRLLWLHQHGLLYGRISHELLIHALLIQAGTAAGDLQYGVAANCCRMAYDPVLVAAAQPLLLWRNNMLKVHGYDVAVKVYQSRVLAAFHAEVHEQGLLQLQHLEQLQNLARVMAVLQAHQTNTIIPSL
jgi:hypothetical protein